MRRINPAPMRSTTASATSVITSNDAARRARRLALTRPGAMSAHDLSVGVAEADAAADGAIAGEEPSLDGLADDDDWRRIRLVGGVEVAAGAR